LCLILAASAPAGDAFHKSIPILRLVAGIETTGFPGTGDWEMGPVLLFCTFAPEVHANTNLFQKQRRKKDNNDCRWHIPLTSMRSKLPFLFLADSYKDRSHQTKNKYRKQVRIHVMNDGNLSYTCWFSSLPFDEPSEPLSPLFNDWYRNSC
jgi:hypothetical protein